MYNGYYLIFVQLFKLIYILYYIDNTIVVLSIQSLETFVLKFLGMRNVMEK